MYSMTGFARRTSSYTIEGKNTLIEIQLKSINAKSCDVQVKTPTLFSLIEIDTIKGLKNRFKRGTLSCLVWLHGSTLQKPAEIDYEMALHYHMYFLKLQALLNNRAEITIRDLINLPGVMVAQEKSESNSGLEDAIRSAIDEASQLLEVELLREGNELALCMNTYIATVHTIFSQLHARIAHVHELKKKKLNAIALEVASSLPTSDALSVELFRQLEKCDLAEEIQRFESHLHRLKELIDAPLREKGRHGDFILQELFREINTISAKCNDSEISQNSILIKIELEKIREQMCNVA